MALGRRASEPLGRLVRFDATDAAPLAGLLFEPLRQSKRAVIFLHGTGGASVFNRTHERAAVALRVRIAYFTFNNRGAPLVRRPPDPALAYEKSATASSTSTVPCAALEPRYRDHARRTLHRRNRCRYDSAKRRTIKRHVLRGGDDAACSTTTGRVVTWPFWGARDDRPLRSELVPRAVILPDELALVLRRGEPERRLQRFPFLESCAACACRDARASAVRGTETALFVYGETRPPLRRRPPLCRRSRRRPRLAAQRRIAVMAEADHGFGL
jgi:hypothetical protein